MKTHGNMCTQPSPCEQAQAKKTPVGSKGEQPLFIPNQKRATRDSFKGTKPLRMD